MFPNDFQYFAPATLSEAIGLLEQHGDEAKLLAGGHSLLPAMKLRLSAPGVLVDLNKISELRGISVNGTVTIGAMTTYRAIEQSAELRAACAVLPEAVALIGDAQVRNRGTIGGALAHADPAADLPAVVLALDASFTAQGPGGVRSIGAHELFVDLLTTSLEPTEIMTSITLPRLGRGEGAAYLKLMQPASRYAIVGVAAYLKLDVGGVIEVARVAVTGAGPVALRQPEVEAALVGSSGADDALAAASAQAGESMEYMGDIHASAAYRRAMVKVYTRRALARAFERASA